MKPPARVYQFDVRLLGITPPIWQRIQVPETFSFWDLHVALQDSMGWRDCHLHLFRPTHPVTGKVVEIGIPDDDPFEGDEPILPGWEIPIAHYFPRPGITAPYEYDFGDGWRDALTLEAILPRTPATRYPRCIDGDRACPPEDCGGLGGYGNLLMAMQDHAHEDHERLLEWLGGPLDPEAFDPASGRFDDPALRYELAFEERLPRHPGRRGRRRPAKTRVRSSRAKRSTGRS
jgi:hypothetical protein